MGSGESWDCKVRSSGEVDGKGRSVRDAEWRVQ